MSKIAFVTDLHTLENNVEKKGVDTEKNWKTVLQDLNEKNIESVILGGDNGEKESLNMLFQDLNSFEYRLILGNHDSIKNYPEHMPETSGRSELFYASRIQDFDCIFLDTSSYKLNDEQLKYLQQWLKTAEKPVVFIHHPVLDIGSWMDSKHPLKNRDEVKKILLKSDKEITLICGHYHQYHEFTEGNIRQIIAPAVSYQIPFHKEYRSDTKNFGYLLLDFSGAQVQAEEVKLTHN